MQVVDDHNILNHCIIFMQKCWDEIDHGHNIEYIKPNERTYDDLLNIFKLRYGLDFPLLSEERLFLYCRAGFPKALQLSIEDNNVQLLLASMLLENDFPRKPPTMIYSVVNKLERELNIVEALRDAYELCDTYKDKRPIMKYLLSLRMKNGVLLFPILDKGDNRITRA
jgi:hypothetical protein